MFVLGGKVVAAQALLLPRWHTGRIRGFLLGRHGRMKSNVILDDGSTTTCEKRPQESLHREEAY